MAKTDSYEDGSGVARGERGSMGKWVLVRPLAGRLNREACGQANVREGARRGGGFPRLWGQSLLLGHPLPH